MSTWQQVPPIVPTNIHAPAAPASELPWQSPEPASD